MNKIKIDDETKQTFTKLVNDFLNDLIRTFPEKKESILGNDDLQNIYLERDFNLGRLVDYCCKIYPPRFFDLLYKNNDIFIDDSIDCHFLPSVDFKELWEELTDMDETKNAIWKYLQLILFICSQCSNGLDSFGETAKLFEAIDENDLFNKLEETIHDMSDIFDISNNTDFMSSDISSSLPEAAEIHSHLKGLLDGNLGKLAHEIAQETANELQQDISDSQTVGDVFQKLMKNPNKLMNMVKKVGTKLDEKLKSGEIKESELMKEASELVEKMKNMPGMGGMDKLFSQMGVPTGKNKMNFGAMQSKLKTNMRQATQRERMLKKLEENRKKKQMQLLLQQQQQQQQHLEQSQQENNSFSYTTFGDGTIEKSQRKKRKKKKKNKRKNKL
tara:strand:- start:11 stop:1171 length:1161 start_codon:yes stop_codon:yes gene_type:complete